MTDRTTRLECEFTAEQSNTKMRISMVVSENGDIEASVDGLIGAEGQFSASFDGNVTGKLYGIKSLKSLEFMGTLTGDDIEVESNGVILPHQQFHIQLAVDSNYDGGGILLLEDNDAIPCKVQKVS